MACQLRGPFCLTIHSRCLDAIEINAAVHSYITINAIILGTNKTQFLLESILMHDLKGNWEILRHGAYDIIWFLVLCDIFWTVPQNLYIYLPLALRNDTGFTKLLLKSKCYDHVAIFEFYFPDITLNARRLNLQMILWCRPLMKRENSVFSKVTCCCSAAQDPIRTTTESALVETTLKDKSHFVKTVYSSSTFCDFIVNRESKWLDENSSATAISCTLPSWLPAGTRIAEEQVEQMNYENKNDLYFFPQLSNFSETYWNLFFTSRCDSDIQGFGRAKQELGKCFEGFLPPDKNTN